MMNKPFCRISLIGFFFSTFILTGYAQQPILRDTSFTFYSAFQGVKKERPDASLHPMMLGDGARAANNVVYCTVNGHPLKLDVFYPYNKPKRKIPAVVMIFGGGWRSGDRGMHVQMARAIAEKGYATITIDYRLSTEALYPAAVNDVKTAIKWVRAHASAYHIDKKKIAAWGFSAGGQLAALVGTTANSDLFKGDGCYNSYSDAVQAIIDVDGILAFIHPGSGEGDDSKRTSSATYWFGSGKTVHPELWEQASALNHTDKNTPPILFLNSGIPRMHAGRDDMIKKLDSLGIYHEVHTFNSPHAFIMFDSWYTPALNYTVAFLDKIFKQR